MQRRADRTRVLGVPIDPVSTSDVLRLVRQRIDARVPAQIVTVNAEYVIWARRTPNFCQILDGATLATPDSAGVVWALRRQGKHVDYRVGGSDLIWSLCLQAAEFGHRVFLLGAGEGVADRAALRLQAAFPALKIAGTHGGSPSSEEEASIVHLIRRSRADLLFVAYGAPQQDVWIARNLPATGVACAMGVGGTLDYVAGEARRSPVWVRRSNLDWLWRLVRQPRRIVRMRVLPLFVWLVWREGAAASERKKV